MTAAQFVALIVLAIWCYLLLARGGFWRAMERAGGAPLQARTDVSWPRVTAIIPARNEAGVIEHSIDSLLRQRYPGPLRLVVVDDGSSDGTAQCVAAAAQAANAGARVTCLQSSPLAFGWTGKLWALAQGVRHVENGSDRPDFIWLTDADIVYSDDVLISLVQRAQADGLVLTSLMAKLRCVSWAERALIPAMIFFFQMLYPFAWVNRATSRTAAAAGGCMLVRREALVSIGGIDAIRAELIDDCALARRLKQVGPISLHLSDRARSLRSYPHIRDIREMIARSAYSQLRRSPIWLTATIAGMLLTFVAPVVLAVLGTGLPRWLGLMTWLLMGTAFWPTLRFYRLSSWWALSLPAIGMMYTVFTVDSAYQHWRGRGGLWKGRVQAINPDIR